MLSFPCYFWVEVPCRKILTKWYETTKPHLQYSCSCSFEFNQTMKIGTYYVGFFALNGMFLFLVMQGTLGLVPVENNNAENLGFRIFKWSVVLGLPALSFNLVGHMLWPAVKRVEVPELKTMLHLDETDESDCAWRGIIRIRIVTRGKNPNLVLSNAESAVRVLRACLPKHRWTVEISTDNPLYISQRSDEPIDEILVPKDYRCPNGGKYKARALHYAAVTWPTGPHDWIIHLDEETCFEVNTVRHIYNHCSREHRAWIQNFQDYPKIGQGVIYYGVGGDIDNYFTTLADCVRVADDYGKFRLQYENHRPWIGMHGSFVVCPHFIEKKFGFDHGLAGSITEDAYFALKCWEEGVFFAWIDGFMYEQSPFSALDFIRQRARWFGGLYLVVKDGTLSLSHRICLGAMTLTWATSPLICIAMVTCLIVQTDITVPFRIFLAMSSSLSCWGYVLGFIMTFKPSDGGWMHYFCLFYCVLLLQPFFAICEISGILHTLYRHPSKGFFIVQKEAGKKNLSNNDQMAITEADVERERRGRKDSLLSQISERSSASAMSQRSRKFSEPNQFNRYRRGSGESFTSGHRSLVSAGPGPIDYQGLMAQRRAGQSSHANFAQSVPRSVPRMEDDMASPLLRSGSIGGEVVRKSNNSIHHTN